MKILVRVQLHVGPWAKHASSVAEFCWIDIEPAKQRDIIDKFNFVNENRLPLYIRFYGLFKNFTF